MELREALAHIAEMRERAAAAGQFRGYRAAPVALAGGLALLAAAAQPALVPDPAADLRGYLALWLSAAVVGAVAAGVRILARDWADGRSFDRDLTRIAVGQFAPCLVAGAIVTAAIARHAPEAAWLLPGLWQTLFALGVFASRRLLPRATGWVGAFYLLCGTVNLALGPGGNSLAPWAMGLPFGLGQFAAAAILYWNLERPHARPDL